MRTRERVQGNIGKIIYIYVYIVIICYLPTIKQQLSFSLIFPYRPVERLNLSAHYLPDCNGTPKSCIKKLSFYVVFLLTSTPKAC